MGNPTPQPPAVINRPSADLGPLGPPGTCPRPLLLPFMCWWCSRRRFALQLLLVKTGLDVLLLAQLSLRPSLGWDRVGRKNQSNS